MSDAQADAPQGKSEETRRALISAALRLFVERGYDQATLDDVADAAGFTKGAFYWHFDSKEDLLVEVFEAWVAEGVGNLRRALDSATPSQRVASLDRWHRGDERRSQQWVRFELEVLRLASEKPELGARLRERQRVVRDLLAAALEEELARRRTPGRLSPSELATLVAALSDGLLQQALLDPEACDLFGRGVELILGAAPRSSSG